MPLNAYDYHLYVDIDPTDAVNFDWDSPYPTDARSGIIDPINDNPVNYADHPFGTTGTLQGGEGAPCGDSQGNTWTCGSNSRCNVAIDGNGSFNGCLEDMSSSVTFSEAIASYTIAQNSRQYAFDVPFDVGVGDYDFPFFDRTVPGTYTVRLEAKCKGDPHAILAQTEIEILVQERSAANGNEC